MRKIDVYRLFKDLEELIHVNQSSRVLILDQIREKVNQGLYGDDMLTQLQRMQVEGLPIPIIRVTTGGYNVELEGGEIVYMSFATFRKKYPHLSMDAEPKDGRTGIMLRHHSDGHVCHGPAETYFHVRNAMGEIIPMRNEPVSNNNIKLKTWAKSKSIF